MLWSPNFISCNMASPSESRVRLPASAAITSASVNCSPPWRPNSYLFQIQRHQIHSHYLCHYHFFKTLVVRQRYTPQNFLDFELEGGDAISLSYSNDYAYSTRLSNTWKSTS